MPKTITETRKRNAAVPLSSNEHLQKWVEKMAELTEPASIHWVDGSQEEYDHLCAEMVAGGTFIKLNEELWPGCYYARSDRQRCRARRGSHVHLLAFEGCRGSHQQLGKSLRHEAQAEGPVQRRDARAHHVRAAFQHGSGRFADVADRRAADRLALCRRQHAHHGAHRHARAPRDRQGLQARGALHAHGRRAACARPVRRAVALQQGKIHRPFPGDARDLVVRFGLRRQRAARARSASRCALLRTSRATKAGWPSIC